MRKCSTRRLVAANHLLPPFMDRTQSISSLGASLSRRWTASGRRGRGYHPCSRPGAPGPEPATSRPTRSPSVPRRSTGVRAGARLSYTSTLPSSKPTAKVLPASSTRAMHVALSPRPFPGLVILVGRGRQPRPRSRPPALAAAPEQRALGPAGGAAAGRAPLQVAEAQLPPASPLPGSRRPGTSRSCTMCPRGAAATGDRRLLLQLTDARQGDTPVDKGHRGVVPERADVHRLDRERQGARFEVVHPACAVLWLPAPGPLSLSGCGWGDQKQTDQKTN